MKDNEIYSSQEMDAMDQSEKENIQKRSLIVKTEDGSILTIPFKDDNAITLCALHQDDLTM